MIKFVNWMKFILVLFASTALPVLVLQYAPIDLSGIHLNPIGTNYYASLILVTVATLFFLIISIASFLIDNAKTERLWKEHSLDNMYRALFAGMIANAVAMTCTVIYQYLASDANKAILLVKTEITALFVGLVFFIWSIGYVVFMMSRSDEAAETLDELEGSAVSSEEA